MVRGGREGCEVAILLLVLTTIGAQLTHVNNRHRGSKLSRVPHVGVEPR